MRQSEDYRRGRHVVSVLNVHLVFVTKYRRGVLTGDHLDLLREVFTDVCADFGARLVQCNGEDDHVHLLVTYPPQVAVSRLVNSLKGVSSRRLRQHDGFGPTASTCGPRRTSPPRPAAPRWRRSRPTAASSARPDDRG
jgi:putative transposase